MKAKFLVGVAALMIVATPAFASTPSSDPFGTLSNDQAGQTGTAPKTEDREDYLGPFGDHLRRGRSDDLRPMDNRGQDNHPQPRMDASGVPDPRI